jgi:hypothetical protein
MTLGSISNALDILSPTVWTVWVTEVPIERAICDGELGEAASAESGELGDNSVLPSALYRAAWV